MELYDYMEIKKNKIEITFLKYDVCIKLPDSFYSDFDVTVKYYKNKKSEPEERTYQLENLEDSFKFVYNNVRCSKNLVELDEQYKGFYLEPATKKEKKKVFQKVLNNRQTHKD